MDGSEAVFFHQAFRNQDGIFKVAAFPRDKGDHHVLSQCKVSIHRGGGICQHISLVNALTLDNCRALVNARALIGALIFPQQIGLQPLFRADNDFPSSYRNDFAIFIRHKHLTGIFHGISFHAGRDQRNDRGN